MSVAAIYDILQRGELTKEDVAEAAAEVAAAETRRERRQTAALMESVNMKFDAQQQTGVRRSRLLASASTYTVEHPGRPDAGQPGSYDPETGRFIPTGKPRKREDEGKEDPRSEEREPATPEEEVERTELRGLTPQELVDREEAGVSLRSRVRIFQEFTKSLPDADLPSEDARDLTEKVVRNTAFDLPETLTLDQLRAIGDFTISSHSINSLLWGVPPDDLPEDTLKNARLLVDLAESARLPEEVVLFRGISLSTDSPSGDLMEFVEAAETGESIRMAGMQSSTPDLDVAVEFATELTEEQFLGALFQIRTEVGLPLEAVSEIPGQQEVLIGHDREYRVASVGKMEVIPGEFLPVIELEVVSPAGQPTTEPVEPVEPTTPEAPEAGPKPTGADIRQRAEELEAEFEGRGFEEGAKAVERLDNLISDTLPGEGPILRDEEALTRNDFEGAGLREGATLEEIESIDGYVAESDLVNEELREGVVGPGTQKMVDDLNGLIDRSPEGPRVVYRGLGGSGLAATGKLVGDFMGHAETGEVFRMAGFQSTTLDPDVAVHFAGGLSGIVLAINTNKGLPIGDSGEVFLDEFVLGHDWGYRVKNIAMRTVGFSEETMPVVELEVVDFGEAQPGAGVPEARLKPGGADGVRQKIAELRELAPTEPGETSKEFQERLGREQEALEELVVGILPETDWAPEVWDPEHELEEGLENQVDSEEFLDGIGHEEQTVLESYTGGRSTFLNDFLREEAGAMPPAGDVSPAVERALTEIETIQGLLDAAPKHPTKTVYRGLQPFGTPSDKAEVIAGFLEAAESGETLRMPGFQSTSVSVRVGTQFSGKHPLGVLLEISTNKGLPVVALSQVPEEGEIILGHDWEYEIRGVSTREIPERTRPTAEGGIETLEGSGGRVTVVELEVVEHHKREPDNLRTLAEKIRAEAPDPLDLSDEAREKRIAAREELEEHLGNLDTGPRLETDEDLTKRVRNYPFETVIPGLTTEQQGLVTSYAGDNGSDLNRLLRRGQEGSRGLGLHGQQIVEALEEAIFEVGALGTLQEEGVVLYRGLNFAGTGELAGGMSAADKAEFFAGFQEAMETGEIIRLPGFQSTSSRVDVAGSFAMGMEHEGPPSTPSDRVILEIKAVEGLPIRALSEHPTEEEVILGHNREYRVTGMSRRSDAPGVTELRDQVIVISLEMV